MLDALNISTFGAVHTAVGMTAVIAGLAVLARDREVRLDNPLGFFYVVATLITAVTGLGIFRHGGFGPPHALSILTILALGGGTLAATTGVFGRAARYVQAVCFSTSVLFHFIPGFTETLVRLPVGAPFAKSPEDPVLLPIFGALFAICGIGLAFQLRWLRAAGSTRKGDSYVARTSA